MNNSIPQVTLIYDRRKRSSGDKEGSIEIRITYNYAQKYIGTGIKVLPSQWKKGTIVNHREAVNLNRMLDKQVSDIRKAIFDMMDEGVMDIASIPARIRKANTPRMDFIGFCRKRAEVRKYGKTKDSQRRYDTFLRFLDKYGKIREFSDITQASIIALDRYLKKMNLRDNSKWNNYHRFLNSFILDAMDEGLIYKNPYNSIHIDKDYDSRVRRYLTPSEFMLIRNVKLPTKSLERVRDLFVFQTYTCLSYTDLKTFDIAKIQEVNGMKVYMGFRHKTNIRFTIPLLKPALDILDKYNNNLPVISNVKYNEYLKVVAQAAGIDRPVSTHWARHTGATLLLNEGIDMQVVSKICGHSSTRITEKTYAKLLDETVVDAVSRIRI